VIFDAIQTLRKTFIPVSNLFVSLSLSSIEFSCFSIKAIFLLICLPLLDTFLYLRQPSEIMRGFIHAALPDRAFQAALVHSSYPLVCRVDNVLAALETKDPYDDDLTVLENLGSSATLSSNSEASAPIN
jgi:hypothetical protein